MELIVGTNSYMTLDEANEIVSTRMISSDPERKYWESLEDSDKQVIILNSTEKIDTETMFYKGFKCDKNQTMQFPRVDDFGNVIECPKDIKIGILKQGIKETLALSSELEQMRDLGVRSFSDGGGASVTFENSSVGYAKNTMNIYSEIYKRYFKPYTILI